MNKKIAILSAAMLLSSTAWAGTTTTGISNASGSAPIVSGESVQQPQSSMSASGATTTGISNASGLGLKGTLPLAKGDATL